MKILIGGSPCTHWSIAQTKNRETEPTGVGWELFENYLIALEKFRPDYFLYENNKSMSSSIRGEITRRLGVEPICINSALMSAQNRQRLYWTNIPGVQQPEDRGILLRDILESGVAFREKGYTLKARYCNASAVNAVDGGHFPSPMVAEVVNVSPTVENSISEIVDKKGYLPEMFNPYNRSEIIGKSPTLSTGSMVTSSCATLCVEPVRIGTIENMAKNQNFDSQQYRVYSPDAKSVTLCGQGGGVGAKTGLYAVPCAGRMVGRRINEDGHRDDYNESIERFQRFEINENPAKTNCLSTVCKDNLVIESANRETYPVYEVRNGLITIKGKRYPIKLADGFYVIRKLTVTECKRLQTVPDSYVFPVSDTQAYKMLGNGWTVDVIAHIFSHCPGITTKPLKVLSMYDGMSCGHIALDKLGARLEVYYATEIDKYAIQTTQANYPDTVQLGDAFQVREKGWVL